MGPIPNDDFIEVSLNRASDGVGFTSGSKITNGLLNQIVTIGYDERAGKVVRGNVEGMVNGTPMVVLAQQYHANGTLVDSSATTPYGTLDLFSYPWCLMNFLSTSVSDAAVLAAVTKLFANAP